MTGFYTFKTWGARDFFEILFLLLVCCVISFDIFSLICAYLSSRENALVFDNYYGTLKSPVMEKLNQGQNVLFDIDWQGTQKLSNYSKNDIVSIFILPPSNSVLLSRLKKRNEDAVEIVKKSKTQNMHFQSS